MNYNGFNNISFTQFTMNLRINYEILITSFELKINLDKPHLEIFENDINLNLKFNYFINDNGKLGINFHEKFIFRPSNDYKLALAFNSKNFSGTRFSDKSALISKDEDSGKNALLHF